MSVFVFLHVVAGSPQPVPAEQARPAAVEARHIGPKEDLADLVLVRSDDGAAVVRFGAGALEMVSVGDRLGRHRAEVKEIEPGRMVLEESFPAKDGQPNLARIVIRDGEKGGKRYLRRSEQEPATGTRPKVVIPKGTVKKPGE